MKDQCFSLQPFPSAGPRPCFQVTGSIARCSNRLAIRYALPGPLAEFTIPAPAAMPTRNHGLWEETCFELFLAVMDLPGYWECNLSPAGHWNVYRFAAYRQGMEEERDFLSLPFRVERQSDSLSLGLELDLKRIARVDQVLDVAVSAVLKRKDGSLSYWALTHRGPQPDFHRRESFVVAL
jgi:hypothetical protein